MDRNRQSTTAQAARGREPEAKPDHAPKTYSQGEQILFGAKLLAVVGALVAILWLLERSL
jgi:hypothetical protein